MSLLKKIIGQPHSLRRIYGFSATITLVSLLWVLFGMGPTAFFTIVVLCALEITFSFDNAVVNAKVLNKMSAFWRKMFMTVGIFIAVFGMRLVLPIVLVAMTSGLDTGSVVNLALAHPDEYAEKLSDSHAVIASFGGMFLLMLFLDFMFDYKRDVHWLHVIEKPLVKIGQLQQLPFIVALIVLWGVTELFGGSHKLEVITSGIIGMITYLVIHTLARFFEMKQHKRETAAKAIDPKAVARAGFFSFLYLEVLDASFSFDGVIGAFAITKMVVLIAVGLGVGAIWVRSMTVHMVRRHTLSKYRYLDHGAHYAIGALAAMLLIGISHEIPEYITGTIGIGIIVMAFISSWLHNRRELAPQKA